MTDEEKDKWQKDRRKAMNEIIEQFDMERRCGLTREEIYRRVDKAMVSMNLGHLLADVVNSLMMDVEDLLRPMGVAFDRNEKYCFKQMAEHARAAKKWAGKSAMEAYMQADVDLFCDDSDLWYNLVRLIEDRTGADKRKNRLLVEWLVNMPSELGVFNIREEDFQRYSR